MTKPVSDDLAARVDRLESTEAIRRLALRYAAAVDARDLDALVALFVDDVGPAYPDRGDRGRPALRTFFDMALRTFTTSVHFVVNHTVDFVDADHARGVQYCRAEHEVGDQWIVMAKQYRDRYERRGGEWFFTGRSDRNWYAVDVLERPVGPDKVRWNPLEYSAPSATESFPTWAPFWASGPGQS